MFDRVLIPVPPDAPDASVAAFGIRIADHADADLLLLSVLDRPQQRDQIRADQADAARESTDPILELADDRDVSVERIIEEGDAEDVILDTIAEKGADLVVLGTHARTGVDRLLLGSVAESTVRAAPVPVLTVTPDATSEFEMPST